MRIPRPGLTPDRVAEAERIYRALHRASEDEHWAIAQLLAATPDGQLLGAAEFEVRDRVHRVGVEAIEAALDGRKSGVRGVVRGADAGLPSPRAGECSFRPGRRNRASGAPRPPSRLEPSISGKKVLLHPSTPG